MKKSCFLFLVLYVANGYAQLHKAPAYPLVTHNPYFSIWSFADSVNARATTHWTGKPHPLSGFAKVDGNTYRFLGDAAQDNSQKAVQDEVTITATQTSYRFHCGPVRLKLVFTSPLLMNDLDLL
ncbi:MAG TPA: DUF4964 domain-containing protein, partial [Chitinophagaceae bacterium]|nr:DUF4964 domain-containing protein [Chitinophagaceae bacterium]